MVGLLSGCLAGAVGLALDQLLAWLTLAYLVPVTLRLALWYVAIGGTFALALVTLGGLCRRRPIDPLVVFSVALAALYAPAVFERVEQAFGRGQGAQLGVLAAVVALGGYWIWVGLLWRLARGPAGAFGPLLAALSAAVGLAVNRNLVGHPLDWRALAADGAIAVGSIAAAWWVGRRSWRAAWWLAGGAAASLVVAAAMVVDIAPGGAGEALPRAGGQRRPDLLLVIIDTLRQDVFSRVVEETEEGRAFARAVGGAAWFDNAIAAAPWTVPSVGSIMTGLYPPEHGFRAAEERDPGRPLVPMAASVPTLSQRLKAEGLLTAAVGTNPLLQPVSGIARGFASYEILSGATDKMPLGTVLAALGLIPEDPYQQADAVRRRLAPLIADLASDERPFFLWIHLMDPHMPLHRHPELSADPAAAGLDADEVLYRDETRFALRELSRIIAALEARGRWRDCAFVLVGDHGEMFPSDGHDDRVRRPRPETGLTRFRHGHALYGELVRVPLVIRPPGGLDRDRRVAALVSHVDLMDTVADLLELPPPRIGRDRVSLVRWLQGGGDGGLPAGRERALVCGIQHGPRQRALRTATAKVIARDGAQTEVYELTSDPGERVNLSRPDETTAGLRDELEELWASLQPAASGEAVELDEVTRKRLEALGYVP
jgi:arylsulfatase A-like enzyme